MATVRLDIPDSPSSDSAAPGEEEQLTLLRTRAADVLERAYGFVREHGDRLANVRVDVHLEAQQRSALDAELARRQLGSGGFPELGLVLGGAAGLGGLAAAREQLPDELIGTLEALLIAGDSRLLHAEWVPRATAHLETLQRGDGSWGPVDARAGMGGEEGEQDADPALVILMTGMIGGILGRTHVVRSEVLARAGDYLGERWAPEQVEGGSYSMLLAFAHFFTNVHHDLADEALQWCGRELERGFRSKRFDAATTTRALLTCDAQAMPGATFDAVELIEGLLAEQAGDGGFAELAIGGPCERITPTVDAILSLVRLCRAL